LNRSDVSIIAVTSSHGIMHAYLVLLPALIPLLGGELGNLAMLGLLSSLVVLFARALQLSYHVHVCFNPMASLQTLEMRRRCSSNWAFSIDGGLRALSCTRNTQYLLVFTLVCG